MRVTHECFLLRCLTNKDESELYFFVYFVNMLLSDIYFC